VLLKEQKASVEKVEKVAKSECLFGPKSLNLATAALGSDKSVSDAGKMI
jgi:hypothetical protein